MNAGYTRKTIKHVLRSKLSDWFSTIEDEKLREMMERDVIVTGGSIVSMLLGEKANDYDIYFSTIDTTLAVTQYYVNKLCDTNEVSIHPQVIVEDSHNIKGEEETRIRIKVQSSGIASEDDGKGQAYEYFENSDTEDGTKALEYLEKMISEGKKTEDKYSPIFMTENAITLSDKVQIVIRFYGEPEEIHKNYDFVHTTNYYTYHNDHLELKQAALEAILSKKLVYVGSLYPVCSLFRARKFIRRGWRVSVGELFKMAYQISSIDLSDPEILKEQLTGADTAYMLEIISIIESERNNINGKKIDSTYIMNLVDRIFNDGDSIEDDEN